MHLGCRRNGSKKNCTKSFAYLWEKESYPGSYLELVAVSRDFVDLASHVSEGYSGAEDVFGCGTWYQSFLCGGDSAHLIFYGSALYEADKFDGYFK